MFIRSCFSPGGFGGDILSFFRDYGWGELQGREFFTCHYYHRQTMCTKNVNNAYQNNNLYWSKSSITFSCLCQDYRAQSSQVRRNCTCASSFRIYYQETYLQQICFNKATLLNKFTSNRHTLWFSLRSWEYQLILMFKLQYSLSHLYQETLLLSQQGYLYLHYTKKIYGSTTQDIRINRNTLRNWYTKQQMFWFQHGTFRFWRISQKWNPQRGQAIFRELSQYQAPQSGDSRYHLS